MTDDPPVLRLDDLARRAIAARVRHPEGEFFFDFWSWFHPRALRKPKVRQERERKGWHR